MTGHEISVKAFFTSALSLGVSFVWVSFIDDTHKFSREHTNLACVAASLGFGGLIGLVVSIVGMIWL